MLLIFISITCFVACLKDPCANVFCNGKGECINGACLCENKYIGEQCENSYASYFADRYKVFDNKTDSIIDTTIIYTHNSGLDSIAIGNYAGLSNNLRVLSVVQNDSMINIVEKSITFFTEDSLEQKITVYGNIKGKPTDTLQLTSTYNINNDSFTYNKKLLVID